MRHELANDNDHLFKMLDAGHVDVVVVARINGLHVIKKLNIPHLKQLLGIIAVLPFVSLCTQKNKDLLPKLNAVFQQLEKENFI